MFLNEEPHRELEVLSRPAGELFQLGDEKARSLGFETSSRVEYFEHGQAHELLDFEVVFGLRAFRHEAPAFPLVLTMDGVVPGAPFRIAQDRVRFRDRTEPRRIARLLVVWMEPLGEEPIDAMNRFRLGVDADLQRLVVIGCLVVCHKDQMSLAPGSPWYR